MKSLVTGGTGFLGAHLARALQARGDTVVCVSRRPGTSAFAHDLPWQALDLTDAAATRALVAAGGFDRVYHLASHVEVQRDLDRVDDQIRHTQLTAVHVARACLEAGVPRLVHVGTCEEYGNGPAPFRESQAPAPVSPYSAAKVAATAFVQMLSASHGLPAVILRPFLTYGPGQPARMLLPALIRSALRGEDFPMTPGEQTREFNYVDDIVDGIMRAGEAEGVEGEILNLGCGEPHRIRDVALRVVELMGHPMQVRLGELPYRGGETMAFYCDNTKARRRLGWRPRVDLDEGLRRTIAWYREHPEEAVAR